MKIAVQLGILPGETVRDQALWAREHGVEGIELNVWGIGLAGVRRQADEIGGLVPISSICANTDLEGRTSFDFLDPDPVKRRASLEGSKAILEICRDVGAVGQVVPPIFGPPKVPDLSPFMTPLQIEDQLMLATCREIGPFAAERGVVFMLEPLNRYEQHYLRRQVDALRIIEEAGVSGIGLLSDTFHMHIEETNMPRALREAGGRITEVHLADNTRLEPGTGDIDFVSVFRALLEVGFNGYMAYECGVSGETPGEKASNLARSLEYVRDCIRRAGRES